jgi:hypothetical protein
MEIGKSLILSASVLGSFYPTFRQLGVDEGWDLILEENRTFNGCSFRSK